VRWGLGLLFITAMVLSCGCIQKINMNDVMDEIRSNVKNIINETYTDSENFKLNTGNEFILKVGESVEYEGINVTVKNVWFSSDLRDFKTFKPIDKYFGVAEEGYEFLVAYVRIENKGNKTIYTTAHDFIVIDSQGTVYPYSVLTHAFEDKLDFKKLGENEYTEGKIVFIIPKNKTKLKIAYCFGSLADFKSFFSFFKNKWAVWVVKK